MKRMTACILALLLCLSLPPAALADSPVNPPLFYTVDGQSFAQTGLDSEPPWFFPTGYAYEDLKASIEQGDLTPLHACGDYRYALLDDGSAAVYRYLGEETDVVIPDTLDGHPVTRIGYQAFSCFEGFSSFPVPTYPWESTKACRRMTSVTIPDGVVSIGDYAFMECVSLERVSFPGTLLTIGEGAFCSCDSLKSIYLPDSLTVLGDSAFRWCDSLKSVVIPGSVTEIGAGAFAACPSLTVTVDRDSFAEQYCQGSDIPYIYAGVQ